MRPAWVALWCVLMMMAHVLIGLVAVSGKSATNDEPLHLVSGVVINTWDDFRVNPEDPPLWKRFAASGISPDSDWAKGINRTTADWEKMLDPMTRRHWEYSVDALYRTPGVDADAALMSGRKRMALISAALGLLTAWVTWSIVRVTRYRSEAGCAALVAAALYAADPNFLGHGMLVKNDVALALTGLGIAASGWFLGRAVTWGGLVAACLACMVAVTVKFSGVALPVFFGLTLLVRAMAFGPWTVFGRSVAGKTQRVMVALGVIVVVAAASYTGIWAAYGFRSSATPDRQDLDLLPILKATARIDAGLATVTAQTPKNSLGMVTPRAERYSLENPGFMVSTATFLHDQQWVPRPWMTGFLYTHFSALVRSGFLLGEVSIYGWWWYFPAAMAFKSPVGLAVAFCSAVVGVIVVVRKLRSPSEVGANVQPQGPTGLVWTVVALLTLPVLYFLVAMNSSLNLGVRHVLLVYPFIYVFIGFGACVLRFHRSWLRWGLYAGVVAVVIESAVAFPHYVAFFNAPSRAYGPHKLLGDSNLDWGQDLPLLAEWTRKHPDSKLFLALVGTPDPAYYGIRFSPLPGGQPYGWSRAAVPDGAGTIVVGATALQGIYADDASRAYLAPLNRARPIEVLGGTIHLFNRPAPKPRPATVPTSAPSPSVP